MAEEETVVDWGDDMVETTTTTTMDAAAEGGGDDVISLGGAEEPEEEVSPPKTVTVEPSNEKADEEIAPPAPSLLEVTPEKVLPPGWKLQQARSGGTYYFNTVTGKTTWEFPTEDADSKVLESSKPAEEKLAGIQIKGAAKAAPSSENDTLPASKKRDAVSQAKKEIVAEEIPQKRRRSNTPEKKTPEPAQRPTADAPRQREDRRDDRRDDKRDDRRDDRTRESKPREDRQASNGWGRRADIASESNMPTGQQDSRLRRHDNETRGDGYNSRQYRDEVRGGDRNSQRGQNGGSGAAAPTGKFVRPDSYQPDRNRPAYDDRRSSAREDADRNSGRKRDPSPPSRRREDPGRGAEREIRREPANREREDERRGVVESRHREGDSIQSRSSTTNDVRGDRDRDRHNEDSRKSVNRSEPTRASRAEDANSYDRGNRSDRSTAYQNQGYNYMDRGNGPRPPRMPNDVSAGYGPSQGYGPRGYRLDASAGPHSQATPFSPGMQQGYGPRGGGGGGMAPYPAGGARPVRPWIAPEEKAKKWWNKNTGERQPVDPIAAAEAEENDKRNRRSASKPSVEPAQVYKTDRERELAEREATIARKERELGLHRER